MTHVDALKVRDPLARLRLFERSARGKTGTAVAEAVVLMFCGCAAGLATSLIRGRHLGIPGHSILYAALPMAMALALVPRRSFAGTVTTAIAAAVAVGTATSGFGRLSVPSFVAMCSLGPALDLATSQPFTKWHVYLRFLAAGLLANALGMTGRMAEAVLGDDPLGRGLWTYALSYAACGALAGLVSGVVCFRASDRLRDSSP